MATAEGPGPSPVSAGRSESFVNALEDTRYEAPFDQMEAVCRTAGHPVPEVRVVEHLPWSKATMTAQASIRNGEKIFVPRKLLEALSSDALESLLAHELGHIVLKTSKWQLLRRTAATTFWVTLAAAVCGLALGLIANNGSLTLAGTAGVIAAVAVLPFVMHCNRKHEYEADAFAVSTVGLRGIEELMTHNASCRNQPQQRSLMTRLLESHPHPTERLERATAEAKRAIPG
jgi:Zn-dependent protease with chaperone function